MDRGSGSGLGTTSRQQDSVQQRSARQQLTMATVATPMAARMRRGRPSFHSDIWMELNEIVCSLRIVILH